MGPAETFPLRPRDGRVRAPPCPRRRGLDFCPATYVLAISAVSATVRIMNSVTLERIRITHRHAKLSTRYTSLGCNGVEPCQVLLLSRPRTTARNQGLQS